MPQATRDKLIAMGYTSPSVLGAVNFLLNYIETNCPNSPLYIARPEETVVEETVVEEASTPTR